jgi:hypothetical protein
MPERLHFSKKPGRTPPAGSVRVDVGDWANPFKPGEPNGLGFGTVRDRQHAAALFARWLYLDHALVAYEHERHAWMLEHLPELTSRDLACTCPLDDHCHGAVLLIVSNSLDSFAKRNEGRPAPGAGRADGRGVVAAFVEVARARLDREGGAKP